MVNGKPGQGYELTNVKSPPGDERAKARWEAFETLEAARKRYDAAREQLEQRRREVTLAQCEVAGCVTRLQAVRDDFEQLQKLHAEDEVELSAKAEQNPAAWPPAAPIGDFPPSVRVE